MRAADLPTVQIDPGRVRANVERIIARTGVPLIAVIKANAYGLGAAEIIRAIHDRVAGFYCFTLREAVAAGVRGTGKPTICLLGDEDAGPEIYLEHHVRPAVWDAPRAQKLRSARPVLCVDTGMQRFACPRELIDAVLAAGKCDEAFTHATTLEQARLLEQWMAGRGLRLHAAGSSLVDQPQAWLDAVRPGLAMYDGAVRVSAPLVGVRESDGPIGYGGIRSSTGRHGVILVGYSNGLRAGPCRINGKPHRILECGMQSSFVEIGPRERAGDEVALLDSELTLAEVAADWLCTAQTALVSLCRCGRIEYVR